MKPEEIIDKVSTVSTEAGQLLSTLPGPMVAQVWISFQDPRLAAAAITAAASDASNRALSAQYKIPERWISKLRTICLRALRNRQRTLTQPSTTT